MGSTEHSVSKDFPELFHYTNLPAFKKIYESPKFRATHYEDLNDTTEFTRFRLKVEQSICPIIRNILERQIQRDKKYAIHVSRYGGIERFMDEIAKDLINKVHNHTFNKNMYKETFICSFCAHTQPDEVKDGLLSQWRGYGEGGGVCIVLDTSKIEKMIIREYDKFQINNISLLATVLYDNDSNNMIIKKSFEKVFKYFPRVIKEIYLGEKSGNKKKLETFFEAMHDHFLLGSIRVKHSGFHEENEIRIVMPITTRASFSYKREDRRPLKEIRYRQEGNREARYIELFGDDSLPIKRIIVGPSRIQNVNYQTVKDIVNNQNIEVIKSEIPFIG